MRKLPKGKNAKGLSKEVIELLYKENRSDMNLPIK